MTCRWERRRWDGEAPPGVEDWPTWPDGHPKPRTCSACGCVHPDDAVALVHAGWLVYAYGRGRFRLRTPDDTDPVPLALVHMEHYSKMHLAALLRAMEAS